MTTDRPPLPAEITAAVASLMSECFIEALEPATGHLLFDAPKVKAARARLEALIAGLVVWQPIETAPKDGSEVILGEVSSSYAGFWSTADCRRIPSSLCGNWFEECERGNEISSRPAHPTHWRPMPPPPTTTAKDGSVT